MTSLKGNKNGEKMLKFSCLVPLRLFLSLTYLGKKFSFCFIDHYACLLQADAVQFMHLFQIISFFLFIYICLCLYNYDVSIAVGCHGLCKE
jgi:hypothetical protein